MSYLPQYYEVSTDEPTAEEFSQLREEIGQAIAGALDEHQRKAIQKDRNSPWLQLCRLDDLAPALGVHSQTVSKYACGRTPVPQSVMLLMRILHKRVTENPELAKRQLVQQHLNAIVAYKNNGND